MENAYMYDGPIYCFGKVIAKNFKLAVQAETDRKAVKKILDQYRRWNGFTRKFELTLDPDKLKKL